MKISISNLALGNSDLAQIAPTLHHIGASGIEIAPSLIWKKEKSVREYQKFAKDLSRHGLQISGIQSIFYGHPEFQVFDTSTWAPMIRHFTKIVELGEAVGADVVVFGSPKNRKKRDIAKDKADEIFCSFLEKIIPLLESKGITMVLEPNAPDYGADYLTTYQEVVELSNTLDIGVIRPQIDTGCMTMVGEDINRSLEVCIPHHVHISVPNLEKVPGNLEFSTFLENLKQRNYKGWMVIEMLSDLDDNSLSATESLSWLVQQMKAGQDA